MTTGLGDYWRALGKDLATPTSAFLDHFDEYKVLDQVGRAPKSCAPVEQSVYPMIYRAQDVCALMWLTPNAAGSLDLVSHYPMVIDGAPISAHVIADTPWEGNIEGFVHLQINGSVHTCFDPLFPLTGHSYIPNEHDDFLLSGFAISVHPLRNVAEVSNKHSLLASSLSTHYETGKTILVDLSDQSEAKELHAVIGLVKAVGKSEISGLQVFRVTVEAFPGVDLPLIFGATSLRTAGWEPAPGEPIAAIFLLQGCLASAVMSL